MPTPTGQPRAYRGAALSNRGKQILTLVAEGLTSHAIGARAGCAEGTVRNHLRNIMTKLGARNRAHAVALAYQRRIITWPTLNYRIPPTPEA